MDRKTIRYNNLLLLESEFGTLSEVASRCDVSYTNLNNVKNKVKTPAGTERNIGDDLARGLEKGCGKPFGWMDVQHEDRAEEQAGQYVVTYRKSAIEHAVKMLKGDLREFWEAEDDIDRCVKLFISLLNKYGGPDNDNPNQEGRRTGSD